MTRRFLSFTLLATLVAASLLLSGAESRAGIIPIPAPLSDVNNNQVLVGDKTFDFLAVTPSGTQPQPLSGITVVPDTSGSGGTTVAPFGFGLNGPIVSATNSGSSDLSLTYTVMSSNGPITAVNLNGVGSASGAGSSINIAELVINPATGATIGTGGLSGSGSITIPLTQSLTTIEVKKDILATAGPGTASANYSIIDQTFSQGSQVVPEPASMALLGIGLSGLFTLRRLFRRTSVA